MYRDPDIVTASEIGDWAYCPESVRLKALGHPSANQPAQADGTHRHETKARAEVMAGGSIAASRFLIAGAMVALLGLAAWWAVTRLSLSPWSPWRR